MALTKVSSGVIQTNINLDTHDIVSTGIITATKFVGAGQPFSFLPGSLPALAPMPSAYRSATGPTGLHGGGGGAGAYSGSPGAAGPGGGGAGSGPSSNAAGAAGVQYTGGGAGGGQGALSGNGGDGLVVIFYPE